MHVCIVLMFSFMPEIFQSLFYSGLVLTANLLYIVLGWACIRCICCIIVCIVGYIDIVVTELLHLFDYDYKWFVVSDYADFMVETV